MISSILQVNDPDGPDQTPSTADDDPINWESERSASWQHVGDILSARIEVIDPVPPDFTPDCDVDTEDFAPFSQCFGGSGNPPPPTCPLGLDADLDGDGDVDLTDTAIFTQFYSPGSEWCAGGAPTGGDEPVGYSDGADGEPPSTDELYQWLEAYCLVNHIPYS